MTAALSLTDRVAQTLQRDLQPSALQVLDESALHATHASGGAGSHLRIRIALPRLAHLSRLARHRLVYDSLRKHMDGGGVHAIAIEWLDR